MYIIKEFSKNFTFHLLHRIVLTCFIAENDPLCGLLETKQAYEIKDSLLESDYISFFFFLLKVHFIHTKNNIQPGNWEL